MCRHLSPSPDAGGALAKSLLDKAHAAAAAGASIDVGAFDPAKAAGSGSTQAGAGGAAQGAASSYGLQSDGNIGSITFFGGSSQLTFSLSIASETSGSTSTQISMSTEVKTAFEAKLLVVGVGLASSGEASVAVDIAHGATNAVTKGRSMNIDIVLSDPDPGDQFKVEIRKDPGMAHNHRLAACERTYQASACAICY